MDFRGTKKKRNHIGVSPSKQPWLWSRKKINATKVARMFSKIAISKNFGHFWGLPKASSLSNCQVKP